MIRQQRKVAVIQRSLRRYRVPFFEALRARLAGEGVGLHLVYSNPPAAAEVRGDPGWLSWAEQVPARSITLRRASLIWQQQVEAIRDADLVVVEQASGLVQNYVQLARQQVGLSRVAFWGTGRNFAEVEINRGGEVVKRWMSRRAHWWFAYTEESADVVASFGFPRERITVVQNSTDTRTLACLVDQVSEAAVESLRARLGLAGSNVGLFVGSLARARRLDYLFAAADRVREAVGDFELLLAGGGISVDEVQDFVARRPWATYVGPTFDEELAQLLRASKLLLVPGWVGLVATDSFAAGVPLVVSRSAEHPPEVGYIVDGRNGRLVDDRGEPQAYADAVIELLRDDRARGRLVEGCLAARRTYSLEHMVDRFASGVVAALREL